MIDVLYIGGSGRSGSTLVQSILGNLPQFQSVGEVQQIWKYLTWKNVNCSCGVLIPDCPFWSPVLSRLNLSESQSASLSEATKQLDRTRYLLWLTSLYRDSNASFLGLCESTEALYQSIAQSSPEKVIIDSSKTPSHLFLLSKIYSIRLMVLHLVRDARAVAYSWDRRMKRKTGLVGEEAYMDRRPMIRTIFRWNVENWYTDHWSRDQIPNVLMRYEDFINSPYGELMNALAGLGFKNIDLDLIERQEFEFQSNHGIGGNPGRFEKSSLRIEDRGEWRTKMPMSTQVILGILAAPLMARYGYRIR
jgi:Sulfotransferase family